MNGALRWDNSGAKDSSALAGAGWVAYWSWLPSRWGGSTMCRAIWAAYAAPWSERTRCRHRLMPAPVGGPQRLQDGRRHRRAGRLPAGNEHRVRLLQGRQPRVDDHLVAEGGPQGAGVLGTDPEVVVHRHVLPDSAEDLGGAGEFEGRLGRMEQRHHAMTVHGKKGTCGAAVPHIQAGSPTALHPDGSAPSRPAPLTARNYMVSSLPGLL